MREGQRKNERLVDRGEKESTRRKRETHSHGPAGRRVEEISQRPLSPYESFTRFSNPMLVLQKHKKLKNNKAEKGGEKEGLFPFHQRCGYALWLKSCSGS